ncbi:MULTISPECIES: 50S ribosomal protein L18e [Acidiplasma]|jgi:large subunit ribosomal protein L18e|uniref:50S ribosomal protein L18e n=2 Tax=Acidiplasma TaxID=507753 RepID=A0A0Q0VX93_9ARCH|nr:MULTISPECIES: 50S ribosomal protein L18e [Acidiplasma]KJE49565.1 50S ribosomal protein L18e [Acidiplasma sp. MBA-1]KPV44973.1 50S ribosomal protein L18e [Acidiplasma aeolicum]KQB34057.1 50S ribosomal protein L18e [Acidiplasma aeolicum]KQB36321.1 50S ribosomal protein L18e [Acidiplasma cupricumulans]WMT54163.1 MAG: 50S ribosomal protein L18e [Acidiplasma sp.]
MSIKVERKTSIQIVNIITGLLERSRESGSPFWRDIALRLSSSRRNYAKVNLGKLNDLVNDSDVIVIPGFLLSSGIFNKKIKIAALKASPKARAKLEAAGAEYVDLQDLANENPKGTGIKIIR